MKQLFKGHAILACFLLIQIETCITQDALYGQAYDPNCGICPDGQERGDMIGDYCGECVPLMMPQPEPAILPYPNPQASYYNPQPQQSPYPSIQPNAYQIMPMQYNMPPPQANPYPTQQTMSYPMPQPMQQYSPNPYSSQIIMPMPQNPTIMPYPMAQSPTMMPYPMPQNPTILPYPMPQSPTIMPYPMPQNPTILPYPMPQNPSPPTILPYPMPQNPSPPTILPYPMPQNPTILPYPMPQVNQNPTQQLQNPTQPTILPYPLPQNPPSQPSIQPYPMPQVIPTQPSNSYPMPQVIPTQQSNSYPMPQVVPNPYQQTIYFPQQPPPPPPPNTQSLQQPNQQQSMTDPNNNPQPSSTSPSDAQRPAQPQQQPQIIYVPYQQQPPNPYYYSPPPSSTLSYPYMQYPQQINPYPQQVLSPSSYGQQNILPYYPALTPQSPPITIPAQQQQQQQQQPNINAQANNSFQNDAPSEPHQSVESSASSSSSSLQAHIEPKQITVNSGANVILRCHVINNATGKPPIKYHWKFNDNNNSSILTLPTSNTRISRGSLMIKHIRKEDAGQYLCVATNSAGESVAEATIHVVESNETNSSIPFTVEIRHPKISVKPKEDAEFHCRSSIHGVTYEWQKENGVLPDTAKVSHGTLKLFGITESSLGTYICNATSPAGENKIARALLQMEHKTDDDDDPKGI